LHNNKKESPDNFLPGLNKVLFKIPNAANVVVVVLIVVVLVAVVEILVPRVVRFVLVL